MKKLKALMMAAMCFVIPFAVLAGCASSEAPSLPLTIYQTDELYFKNGELNRAYPVGTVYPMGFPIVSNRPLQSVDAVRIYDKYDQKLDADIDVEGQSLGALRAIRLAEAKYLNNLRLNIIFRGVAAIQADIRRIEFDIEDKTVEFITDISIRHATSFSSSEPHVFGGTVLNVKGNIASFVSLYQSGNFNTELRFDNIDSLLDGINIVELGISELETGQIGNETVWYFSESTPLLDSFVETRLRVEFDFGGIREQSIFFGHNFRIGVTRLGAPLTQLYLYLSPDPGMGGIENIFEEVARSRNWELL